MILVRVVSGSLQLVSSAPDTLAQTRHQARAQFSRAGIMAAFEETEPPASEVKTFSWGLLYVCTSKLRIPFFDQFRPLNRLEDESWTSVENTRTANLTIITRCLLQIRHSLSWCTRSLLRRESQPGVQTQRVKIEITMYVSIVHLDIYLSHPKSRGWGVDNIRSNYTKQIRSKPSGKRTFICSGYWWK